MQLYYTARERFFKAALHTPSDFHAQDAHIAWLMHRYPSAGVFMRYGFVLLGSLCVFVPGVGYLAHLFGWGTALKLGLFPFVLSDLTKIIFAVSLSKVIGNKLLQRKH